MAPTLRCRYKTFSFTTKDVETVGPRANTPDPFSNHLTHELVLETFDTESRAVEGRSEPTHSVPFSRVYKMDRTGVNLAGLPYPIIDELHADRMLHSWHSARFVSGDGGMEAGFELPFGSAYFGDVRNDGVAEGYGRHECKSDAIEYNGDFSEGTMHGQGRLKVNGSVIDGSFHEGEMLEGEHRVQNGPTYTGKLKEGTWTGRCKIVYPGGDVYEGAVQNGVPHGPGARRLPSGTTYTGKFVNGRKEGEGRMALASGTMLQGHFRRGTLEGAGFVCNADDSMLTSTFVKGQAQGKGKYEFMNGLVYEGEFRNGKMYGDGVLTYSPEEEGSADGFVFKGQMLHDRACGEGELNFGEHKYSGTFEEEGPEGQWTIWELVGKKKIQSKARTVTYHRGERTDVFEHYKPAAVRGASGGMDITADAGDEEEEDEEEED